MKIYTKTGDKGETGLIGGTRVSKSDLRLEAYGTIDELNSHLGMLLSMELPEINTELLFTIQKKLFTIGAYLATDNSKTNLSEKSQLTDNDIIELEKGIDTMDTELQPLKYFVLPGGSIQSSQCHICRTVTRRAERRIIELNNINNMDEKLLKYINRLSDFFFTLSRFIILKQGKEEIYWK